MTTWIVFYIILAYFAGAISSAILICKLFNKPDPRSQGSKNPGATNVLRVAGKLPAILVLVFDVLKGALPTYAAYIHGIDGWALGIVGICACLGHMYPVYFKFSGGKAVATALGAMFPIGWPLALSLLGTWLIVFRLSAYSSLAAIITLLLAPVYTHFYKPEFTLAVAMLSMLILVKHKSNISRLIRGEEKAIKSKKD
ncbi:glycerol-3-phosphate 1-O-acyltransferase PlsY [Agaribacter marinus]|uniref:Glycerol-3-phosphate acyltransferase n=1 Tax=Agaribacter marinus TaxID=1431249 RepID=A0AA37SWR3_9ALTE|nr:glycerol-3-phosphate 1-O-acyltransferase PlsY [Agaribacter marinus]GLR71181.1 glycerol-3-phosphate acyltransferase [Agaribacter marinus]